MSESELLDLDLDSPRDDEDDDDDDDDAPRDLEPESLLLPLLLRWLLDDACEDDDRVLELLLASRLLELLLLLLLLLLDEEGRAVREAEEDWARSRDAFDDDVATAFLRELSLELLLGRVRVTVVFEVLLTPERESFRFDDAEGLLADSRDREGDDCEGVRLAVIFDRLRSALLLPPL